MMLISESDETQWADILIRVPCSVRLPPYLVTKQVMLWVLRVLGKVTEKRPVSVSRSANLCFDHWIQEACETLHSFGWPDIISEAHLEKDKVPVWLDLNLVHSTVLHVLAGSEYVYSKGSWPNTNFSGPTRRQRVRIADAVIEELCHSTWCEISSDLSL